MSSISVENITYRYGGSSAGVDNISFNVAEGSIVCLVGPSGCGKSTLLRLIAGFLKPQNGRIALDGDTVAGPTWVPPEKRGIGLVFQQHALFPHLTAARNILFGTKDESMADKLLADFHLHGKAERFPHELSGGEQQRVALARALAARPKALLMDEPFASIDSVLRRQIRMECIDILRKDRVTTLLVTHDAEEAMELADHIIVMEQGAIVQSGTARELYTHPANPKVAGLFGEVNHITDVSLITALTGKPLARLLLRPEALAIRMQGGVPATITHIYFRGSALIVRAQTQQGISLLIETRQQDFALGQAVGIEIKPV